MQAAETHRPVFKKPGGKHHQVDDEHDPYSRLEPNHHPVIPLLLQHVIEAVELRQFFAHGFPLSRMLPGASVNAVVLIHPRVLQDFVQADGALFELKPNVSFSKGFIDQFRADVFRVSVPAADFEEDPDGDA